MTALRQQVFEMLESVPEENLLQIIQYIQAKNLATISKAERIERKRLALEELKKLCRPIPELDAKAELAQYREERFGAGIS